MARAWQTGRGAYKKTIVFGMLKRDDCVYTHIVPNCRAITLQAVIRGHVALDSTILSDCLNSYDGLVDLGYAKHLRIRHSEDHFADGPNHINGIESFWAMRSDGSPSSMGYPSGPFRFI